MLAEVDDDTDVVYCAWNEIPQCCFQSLSSTSGNFLVRTEVGRRAGYLRRDYEADGHFIDAVAGLAREVRRVDQIVYFWNKGVRE
jgi:hypothetical protein